MPGKVLVCATGSVAGIKVVDLVELLQDAGLECRVVASQHGGIFVDQPQNGQQHSGHVERVQDQEADENLHVQLADWADLLLVAPLSSNSLAKLALGLCDNLVTRIARCWDLSKPMLVAPAMNTRMWTHFLTAQHIKTLEGFGVKVVPPVSKTLACGDVGVGAMAGLSDLVSSVLDALSSLRS